MIVPLNMQGTTREDSPMRLKSYRLQACSVAIFAATFPASIALAQAPVSPGVQRTTAPIDPRQAAAQAAFEALPEQERKAIQADLIWVTDFSGATSGNFGSLTYRSIQVFERLSQTQSAQSQPDGILTREERKALAETAAKARLAVRYSERNDNRSKARLGIPLTLITRDEANALGGTRWQTADRKVTLETFVSSSETLEQQFARASDTSNPARKVTYKLLRPDFFVVTGETATGKFYRRVVKTETGVSGFAIGYEKAMAPQWDRLTIAIANSFEATPSAQPVSLPATSSANAPKGAPAVVATAVTPPKLPEPRVFQRSATGVVIADEKLLIATAGLVGCRNPTVNGLAFGPIKSDQQAGIGIASVPGLKRVGQVPSLATGKADIVLALAHGATASGANGLLAIPVTQHAGRLAGGFQPGAAGAALLNSSGQLAGLLTSDPSTKVQIAGTVVAKNHSMADISQIAQLLERERIKVVASSGAPAKSTGQMIADNGTAIVAVTCSP
jgi:hypothetical protein